MRARSSSPAASRLQRNGWSTHASRVERLLHSIGADPAFVEAVLGDLAEERAARTIADGPRAAHLWYLREALRSMPHLVASAIRGASWRRRATLMLCLTAIVSVAAFALTRILGPDAAPAQLVATGDTGDGIVVNNDRRPVQLAMRVLDSAGRVMPDTGVRYRWLSGTPIPVTPRGVAKCNRAGDALVRASLGTVATQFVVRCRPVKKVRSMWTTDLILGDPPVPVPFEALDAQGRTVSLLRGALSVEDSTVATLDVAADGTRLLRARAPGTTMLNIRIGDRGAGTGVHVYERASSPEGISKGQYLAIPVELGGGEMRQWHIPIAPENYYIAMRPDGDEAHVPRLAIVGANCITGMNPHSFLCVAQHETSVFVYHSREGNRSQPERGTLMVWRWGWH